MESPERWLTNVYRTEGVLFVQWTAYGDAANANAELLESGVELSARLESAQLALQSCGQIALHDPLYRVLWHFVLAGPLIYKDRKALGSDKSSDVIAAHHLTRLSSGSVRASDIDVDKSPELSLKQGDAGVNQGSAYEQHNPPQLTGISSERISELSSAANGFHQPLSVGQVPSDKELCDRVERGVVRLLMYMLITNGNWLPLGDDALIARFPGSAGNSNGESNVTTSLGCVSRCPRTIAMKAAWLSTGVLLILDHETDCPFTEISTSTRLRLDANSQREDIILAPVAVDAVTIGGDRMLLNAPAGSSQAQMMGDWKHRVEQWLQALGIPLSPNGHWMLVEVEGRDGRPLRVPWPEEFCYPVSQLKSSSGAYENGTLSALDAAESWHTISKESEKELAKQPEQPQSAQGKRLSSPKVSTDEHLVDLLRQYDQARELTATAGIYPTPPDGARAPGAPHPGDAAGSTIWTAGTAMDVDRIYHTQSSEADQNTREVRGLQFEGFEDAELFGHGNENMYADNGITEDDFSFFDEPDSDAGNPPNKQLDVAMTAYDSPPDSAKSSISNIKSDIGVTPEDVSNQRNLENPVASGKLQQNHILAAASHPTEDERKLPTTDATTRQIKPQAIQPSLDDKYGQQGKYFNSSRPPLPSNLAPSGLLQTPSRIPTIRPNSESTSDSDSGDEMDIEPQGVLSDRTMMHADGFANQVNANDVTSNPSTAYAGREALSFAYAFDRLVIPSRRFPKRKRDWYEATNITRDSVTKPASSRWPRKADAAVRIVQLFADQLACLYDHRSRMDRGSKLSSPPHTPSSDALSDVIGTIFSKCIQCDLKSCRLTFQSPPHATPTQKSFGHSLLKPQYSGPINTDGSPGFGPLQSLEAPRFRVRRGGKIIDLSLYAFHFWEELGLSPFEGPKDVIGFCLFPDGFALHRRARQFLDAVCHTYTSLKLGRHTGGSTQKKELESGLMALPTSREKNSDKVSENACEKFGRSLQALATSDSTIVIYMVNIYNDAASIQNLCALFTRVFDCYAANIRGSTQPSDLVLKIINADLFGSQANLSFPSFEQLVELSNEIYDRCPLRANALSPYATHSLVQLSPEVPPSIPFKLIEGNGPSLLEYESVVHLAYCWGMESSWINAVWTDRLGCHSWSAAFYIDPDGASSPAFRAIIEEILEVVKEGMKHTHGRPIILLSKDSAMSNIELEVWTSVAREKEVASFAIALLDDNPAFQLRASSSTVSYTEAGVTPASAPATPDVASPDFAGLKASEEAEQHARLKARSEEAWAIATDRSLQTQGDSLRIKPVLGGGYVMQRSQVCFSATLIYAEGWEMDSLSLLKTLYDLACLAKARGSLELLPWSTVVARNAQIGLQQLR